MKKSVLAERILAVLAAVTSYDVALVSAAWHLSDERARAVAFAMADFGRMVGFAQKPVDTDWEARAMRWAVDVEKSKKYTADDVTVKIASDEHLLEMLLFDILESGIRRLKMIGFTREHRLSGGAYQFSFKLDDGTVVDVLQSPVDVELIEFEVDGKVEVWAGEFYKMAAAEIKG